MPGSADRGVQPQRARATAAVIPISPEDALEPALRMVVEASGASAGALCLYDAQESLLRLTSEIGLSDEGCRRLRAIRHDDPTWSAPLDSLLERRTYVLERAAGEHLPPLVDPIESITAVACLPLYVDSTPRGSVVLVSVGARALSPTALVDLEPALAKLARIIETIGPRGGPEQRTRTPLEGARAAARQALDLLASLRWRTREASPSLESPVPPFGAAMARGPSAEREEAATASLALAETAEALHASAAAQAEAIRAALADAQCLVLKAQDDARRARAAADTAEAIGRAALNEREHLRRSFEDAGRRESELGARIAQVQAELSALRERETTTRARSTEAETQWQARLAEVESERTRQGERLLRAEGERERLAAELEEARVRERGLRREIEDVGARHSAAREETLRDGLDRSRRAEEARAAAVTELEAVRFALGEAQKIVLEAEDRNSNHEVMRRYTADLHERSEQARAAATAELEATRVALAEAHAAALEAREEARRSGGELERLRTQEQDRERLVEALQEARARLAEPTARVTQLEEEIGRLREQLARTESEARERAEQGDARWLARLADLETALATGETRVNDLERVVARHGDELAQAEARERHARELLAVVTEDRDGTLRHAGEITEAAEQARTAAAAESEAIRNALADAQGRLLRAEEETRQAHAEVERMALAEQTGAEERSALATALDQTRARLAALEGEQRDRAPAPARPAGTVASPPSSDVATTEEQVVALIDEGGTLAESAVPGVHLQAVAPGPDLARQLVAMRPARTLVNLAARGALDALSELRTAGFTTPILASIWQPGREAALPLGMIETLRRPIDTAVALPLLAPYLTRGTRILAVGAEGDALLSLRQALMRQGASVSIAWDAKQGSDLIAMAHPQVVIVDLGLARLAGYAFVSDLAALEPVPTIVLITRDGEDAAAAFASMLGDPARRTRAVALRQLVRTILQRVPGAPRRGAP